MSTKLEAMVDYLSGRKADQGLLDELADPSSEASRFLEATRQRSRALLDGPGPAPSPDHLKARAPGLRRALMFGLVAGTLGLVLWAGEVRSRRLEASLARGQAESRENARRIEAALGRMLEPKPPRPSPDPIEAALARVETLLGKLERRLDGPERKGEPKAEATNSDLRDELAKLRRELSANEKTGARAAEELQASIHEAARLLRLLIARSQPPAPSAEPAPAFPPPRPAPNADPRRATP